MTSLSEAAGSPWVLVVVVLVLLHLWVSNSRFHRVSKGIPSPLALPIIGHLYLLFNCFYKPHEEVVAITLPAEFGIRKDRCPDFMTTVLSYAEDYPSLGKVWLGPSLMAVGLLDPRDVEVILSSSVHINKSPEYQWFKPWLGNGLLISSGETWRSHRKLIAPAFHLNVLRTFLDNFNKNARVLMERMSKEVGGPYFDAHDYLSETTVDTLLETVMGVPRSKDDRSGFSYAMAVMRMCEILHQRMYKLWMRMDFVYKMTSYARDQQKHLKTIHELSSKVFRKKQELLREKSRPSFQLQQHSPSDDALSAEKDARTGTYFDQTRGLTDDLDDDVGEKKRLPFLELLLKSADNGQVITEKQVREQVDTIMFEGHDTVAAASSFVLCLLGYHKHIQDKVYKELRDIFGDSDRPATFVDTLEMKYLERVILETLRLYPPVPAIARLVNTDVKLASGDYTIPAGCIVVIGTYKIHRDPKVYPNPTTFDPDNFLPETTQSRHYYSFIPFSAGPRSCVGRKYAMLKLKVLLSTLLRNYEILSDISEEEFKLQADIILKRSDGFRIRIQHRRR